MLYLQNIPVNMKYYITDFYLLYEIFSNYIPRILSYIIGFSSHFLCIFILKVAKILICSFGRSQRMLQ